MIAVHYSYCIYSLKNTMEKPTDDNPDNIDKPKPKLSPVARRAIDSRVKIELASPELIAYQHTVLCQTCLPYRNPGNEVREWSREQGKVSLLVEAGKAKHPDTGKWVQLGLPYGTKPRLILAHLNSQALKTGSPRIDMDKSLTAFVRRIQGRSPTGPEIRAFKDQLSRLSAAMIHIAVSKEGRAIQVDSKIVTAFELWFPKEDKQPVLWPATVHLSLDYFNSLQNHAVPLDLRALAALAHSSMGLDIYSWLAQRLHRVPEGRPQFVSWEAIKEQFGPEFGRMMDFKRKFRDSMRQVLSQYPAAHVEEDTHGLILRNSLPPVPKRIFVLDNPVK